MAAITLSPEASFEISTISPKALIQVLRLELCGYGNNLAEARIKVIFSNSARFVIHGVRIRSSQRGAIYVDCPWRSAEIQPRKYEWRKTVESSPGLLAAYQKAVEDKNRQEARHE